MAKRKLTYKDSGVDVDANAHWVQQIRKAMASTYGPRVCSKHNAFAGMFRLDVNEKMFTRNYRRPVLVACADGVGSKVMLAVELGDLSTIGIDLVAMNVNDMITCGAEPLFFLDYLGVHGIDPRWMVPLVEGIADGCAMAGCALLGGETAEMPDLYGVGKLDLAGFSVGVVEFGRQIDGLSINPGDELIGLASSGIHSNGYSLVRRLIKRHRLKLDREYDELGETLGQAVLRPTRVYVRSVLSVLDSYRRGGVVTGMAHITGGGLAENIERVLPKGCGATVRTSQWRVPELFKFLQRGAVDEKEMYRVFNMGIGYVLAVRPKYVAGICRRLEEAGESTMVIGRVKRGRKVELK